MRHVASHTSDSQRRSALQPSESNVHVIEEQALTLPLLSCSSAACPPSPLSSLDLPLSPSSSCTHRDSAQPPGFGDIIHHQSRVLPVVSILGFIGHPHHPIDLSIVASIVSGQAGTHSNRNLSEVFNRHKEQRRNNGRHNRNNRAGSKMNTKANFVAQNISREECGNNQPTSQA